MEGRWQTIMIRVEALIRTAGKLVVTQKSELSWQLPAGEADLALPLDTQAAELASRTVGLPVKIDTLAYVYTADTQSASPVLGVVFRGQLLARTPGDTWRHGSNLVRLITLDELPALDHPLVSVFRADWRVSFAKPATYIAAVPENRPLTAPGDRHR